VRWLVWFVLAGLVVAGAWWLSRTVPDEGPEPRWTAAVRVLAGDGLEGSYDGPADRARFSDPFGIAVAPDGTVYVADAGVSQRIRVIAPDGTVSTLAGSTVGFTDGPGAAARFSTPSGLAVDADGVLYVADTGNHAIRRVTPDGVVSTVAGDGTPGYRDGQGTAARFDGPIGIAVHPDGRLVVADTYNDRIRVITPDGLVSTLAGDGVPGSLDGRAHEARFDTPGGVAIDGAGLIVVADTGNGLIRTIDVHGEVATHPAPLGFGLVRPVGVAVSGVDDLYVTDDLGRVLEVAADGRTRLLAGASVGFADGLGLEARFRNPAGVAVAALDRLVVADAGNALVRAVATPAWLTSHPPASPWVAPRFDAEAFGHLPLLWPVAPMDGPHEVAGTHGESRGSEGAERFHIGIDVRHEHGTEARAVRDGVVRSPVSTGSFGTLNEWLRVGPVVYVHIRAGRTRQGQLTDTPRFAPTYDETGRLVRIRARRGARFATGDVVGTLNPFNHVHLGIGWPGEEYNPLRFRLVQFEDTIPPTIAAGGITVHDEDWTPFTERVGGRVLVSGRVRIVVDAWDQAEGNRPGRRLGLYRLGYQVLRADRTPAPGFAQPRQTLEFDRLPSGSENARLVYAPGSGIPFYGQRRTRFLYVVTNELHDGEAREHWWDTTALPPGDYVVRVLAEDFHGNRANRHHELAVTVTDPVRDDPSQLTSVAPASAGDPNRR
jgi:DNA-binding beta-propeller fold protein YncE